jgi:superfamily I DNA/RNA helicase
VSFQPSKYQEEIFKFVHDGQGSAVVVAVAGSGKTTTIMESLPLIPRTQQVQLFAFNNAIAMELKGRIQQKGSLHARASTFHSVGYRSVCQHLGMRNIETQSRKLPILFRRTFNTHLRAYEAPVCKLVGLAKGSGIGALFPDNEESWVDLIKHHEIELDAADGLGIRLARQLLEKSNEAAAEEFLIDFDDHLYLPCLWSLALPRYEWVIVDEAQDTNAIRRAFIGKSLKEDGRLLAVGDPCQAIYGFTGASVDAIELIKAEWDCIELPLSVSYRCPRRVVSLARGLVSYIEPADGATVGTVDIATTTAIFEGEFGQQDAILCRTNAPLVGLAYECIGRGISCRILGRDIGKGLSLLVDRMQAQNLDDLETRLADYERREVAKLVDRHEHGKAANVTDRVQCLYTIIENLPEGSRTIHGLTLALDSLFGDEIGAKLTLSTVHKAKGKEWRSVAILEPGLMPAGWARQAWEQQQERNLQYVAWTRAKERLTFLEGGKVPWLDSCRLDVESLTEVP